jgi:Cysteine-rich secretory protein family
MTVCSRFLAFLMVAALAGCAEAPAPRLSNAKVVHFDPGLARDRLSEYRRSRGLTPVSLDGRLTALAREQAEAMAARDKLSHEVAGSFSSRIESAGLTSGRTAENVSYGVYTEEDAISQWRASPSHNKNLLMPHASRFGIAYARSKGARQRVYWAMAIAEDAPAPVATLASGGPTALPGSPAAIMAGPTEGGRVVVRRRAEEPRGSLASTLAAPFSGWFGD